MASIDHIELRKFTIDNYNIFAVAVYVLNYSTTPNIQLSDIYNSIYSLSGLIVNGFSAIQNTYSGYDAGITSVNVTDSSNNLKFTQSVSYWKDDMQLVTPRLYINNTLFAFGSTAWGYSAGNPHVEFAPLICFVDANSDKVLTTSNVGNRYFNNSNANITLISEGNTYKFLISNDVPYGTGANSSASFTLLGVNIDDISKITELHPDPYEGGGDSSTSIPTGDFDDASDSIDFPSLPSLGATDTGLITLYNPSLQEVKDLATYMWTNPAFDISAWKKIFADPIDAILGLSIVPVAVPDGGQRHIAVGNLFTDVLMNVAAQQYIELQCGALNVNEFWSSYLDYEPYTKAEIYLPYCGVHQLSVDDIMDKTIEVRYHIDILTGSCCAYVKCGDSVLYQFIGQCSSSIPVASGDFSEIIGSALNAALAVGSLAATGGASAPFAVPKISANAVNILKEKIQKSGSLSGTGGMLALQKPYLILTRPRQAHPANQHHYTGYPSFITENLSELSGYTEIEEIHLENVQATNSELDEIISLLESGVIF